MGRDGSARAPGAHDDGARPPPVRAFRGRRGDAHRDQRQVHRREAAEGPVRSRARARALADGPRRAVRAHALAPGRRGSGMKIEASSALVAGGASGLGEATARRLHALGAALTIADVNAEKGAALSAELEGSEFVACDVREEDQVQEAVQRASAREGGLRISVCCAGTGWAQKVAGSKGPHPLMPFETIIAINLIGTFNVLRFAAAAMISNDPAGDGERGVCVNTASIAAFDGQVGQIAYSASKGGVVAMTLPAAR